jgi:DNA-binding transcriptional LysR family regulator
MNIDGLSLDQMRAALAVSECGSFSAAARQLNRAQSALSYAVTTLETQLGVRLFDRTDGRVPLPTQPGRVLLREMEMVVRHADRIKEQARDIGKGLENELTVTVDALCPLDVMAVVLKDFALKFPSVQVTLNIEAMGAVQRDVLEGTSILGIIGSLPHLPPGLIGDALPAVVRFPVAAREHALAGGLRTERLPHRLLFDHLQIVQSDRSVLTQNREFTVYSGRTLRVSDLAAKRILLLSGLGWGYMPRHMVEGDLVAGTLKRLWVDGLRDQNSIALIVSRRRDRILGSAAQWMLERLLHGAGSDRSNT